MYTRYSLVLMLTHDCTLRCNYCYAGQKRRTVMPAGTAQHAIDRAIRSLTPGGTLELGFFGGEPLLEADLVRDLLEYAEQQCHRRELHLEPSLTTNGTVSDPPAWVIMNYPGLNLAVSCDGVPEVHDAHRRFLNGQPSSPVVYSTIRRLVTDQIPFRVVMVVRPDTLDRLVDSARFLRGMGVRHLEPSLDLWTKWTQEDERRLEHAIAALADFWRDGLPGHSIGWFDEKTAHLARLPVPVASRCGFGNGAVAVAPTGRLYPCERLIGDDRPDNPMRLAGHAAEGHDFLHLQPVDARKCHTCSTCAMDGMCNTFCRCSNYIRTSDVNKPDSLLCAWNQACMAETARVLVPVLSGGQAVWTPLPQKSGMEPMAATGV